MNKDIVNLDLKIWKMALRCLYSKNLISKYELLRYQQKCLFDISDINEREIQIKHEVASELNMVSEFKDSMMIEATFMATGCLPVVKSDFQYHWVGYLADCASNSYITESEFDEFSEIIDFTSYCYNEDEMNYIDMILDVMRFGWVNDNPSAINFIESPSFDLLMFVNGMEEV